MKFKYTRVNDFIISLDCDGDWQYEKKSGSYPIASILGSSRLKYCLKHSIVHRRLLDSANFEMVLSDEYRYYRQLKNLIELMIDYLVVRDDDYYGISVIVEYGNNILNANDYMQLPEFPRNIEFKWYSSTYYTILNFVESVMSYKHKQFTVRSKAIA